MSNYSLTVNSTFKPFIYQELVAPVAHQQQVLDNLAEQYDKLSSQADVLEAMGKNDRDKNSGTYAKYKAYSDRLRAEAESLYRFGLNSESRQRLTDLRRMYNTDIVPIQNAWNKREQESADQMKARLANPSLMFTRDAQSSTLDDYIKNPTGGYGVINGANITAQMASMASNLAKQVRSGHKEGIDDYTYRYIEQFGLDENMIRNWQDSPTLKRMYEQVMQSNGVTPEALNGSLNANDIIAKSTGFAEMGMWNAMGQDKSTVHEDYMARLNAQMQKEIAVQQAKAAAIAGASGNGAMSGTMTESVTELPMAPANGKNPAQKAQVRALNYEKTDWNPNSKNYTVREITGYKDGKPVFDTKTQSLGELLNKKDSQKNDINVSTYWSDTPGHEGIILATTEDGKAHRYLISADSMPESNVQDARKYFDLAKRYKQKGQEAEAKQALELAYRALHTGLTVHNKAYDQSMVRQPSLKQQGLAD